MCVPTSKPKLLYIQYVMYTGTTSHPSSPAPFYKRGRRPKHFACENLRSTGDTEEVDSLAHCVGM